jgi:hypothetical protein
VQDGGKREVSCEHSKLSGTGGQLERIPRRRQSAVHVGVQPVGERCSACNVLGGVEPFLQRERSGDRYWPHCCLRSHDSSALTPPGDSAACVAVIGTQDCRQIVQQLVPHIQTVLGLCLRKKQA